MSGLPGIEAPSVACAAFPVTAVACILLRLHMEVIDVVHQVLQELKELITLQGVEGREIVVTGESELIFCSGCVASPQWILEPKMVPTPPHLQSPSPWTTDTPAASVGAGLGRAAFPWVGSGRPRQAGARHPRSSEEGKTGKGCGGHQRNAGTGGPGRESEKPPIILSASISVAPTLVSVKHCPPKYNKLLMVLPGSQITIAWPTSKGQREDEDVALHHTVMFCK